MYEKSTKNLAKIDSLKMECTAEDTEILRSKIFGIGKHYGIWFPFFRAQSCFSATHIIAHLHVRILSRFDIKNNTMVLFNASVFSFACCWHSGFTIFFPWFVLFSSSYISSSLRTQTFRNYFRIFRICTCAVFMACCIQFDLLFMLIHWKIWLASNYQPPTVDH